METPVDAANLLAYPPGQSSPLGLALTEYHFIVLRKDRLSAMRVEDQRMVWEEIIPLVCCAQLTVTLR